MFNSSTNKQIRETKMISSSFPIIASQIPMYPYRFLRKISNMSILMHLAEKLKITYLSNLVHIFITLLPFFWFKFDQFISFLTLDFKLLNIGEAIKCSSIFVTVKLFMIQDFCCHFRNLHIKLHKYAKFQDGMSSQFGVIQF